MRLMRWLRLARAHSAWGAALAVWVGGRLAGADWAMWWLQPMAVAFLLSAAGNAFNDAHDAVSDQINRPDRPIPRGELTSAQAAAFAWVCIGLALLLAWPFGAGSRLGTVAGAALALLYTTHLKGIPVVGHAVVAVLTGMALGYGGLLAGDVAVILLPAAAFGLFFAAREMLKTIHDALGDVAQGTATLTTRWGPRMALGMATLTMMGALLLLRGVNAGLAWWGVALLCGAVVGPLWSARAQQRVARALALSKALGLALLVALALG